MNIGQLIDQLIAIVKADAAKTILPLLANFFTSIAANPNELNITVQLTKLNVEVLAALPGLEQDVLKQIASTISTWANAAAAVAATPPKV